MRVLELGDGDGLALESAPEALGRELVRAHELDGDAALELRVEGDPDRAHAAARELALEPIFAANNPLSHYRN